MQSAALYRLIFTSGLITIVAGAYGLAGYAATVAICVLWTRADWRNKGAGYGGLALGGYLGWPGMPELMSSAPDAAAPP